MKKIHVAIIIIFLVILAIVGIIIKNIVFEDDELLINSGDEIIEEMIFNDVSENYWAAEYISFLTQRNIMTASGDKNFYPDNDVTFKEFLEILTRASMPRLDFENMSGDDFTNLLIKNNVITEKSVTPKKLNSKVTNYDVAILLAKADIKIRNSSQMMSMVNLTDLKGIDEIAQTLIGHSMARGFFRLDENKNFYPNKSLRRAELAEIIYLFVNE